MDGAFYNRQTGAGELMADILGFLASCGMIALVFVLAALFLRQMGWIRENTIRLLGRCSVMTCTAGILYLALTLLFQLTIYGKIESGLTLNVLFRGPYMNSMLAALNFPRGVGPISLLFATLSYAVASLLFGQQTFCGVCLAWVMTSVSLCLIQSRFQAIADDKAARDVSFLLLCLPGSLFFLLPGCAPVCLLVFSIAFYFLGKRIPRGKLRFSPAGYGWLIAMSAILSSAVTICAAEGRIG